MKVQANTLEEAKHIIKNHMKSQRVLFEFYDETEIIISERKETLDVIPKMSLLWDYIKRGRD